MQEMISNFFQRAKNDRFINNSFIFFMGSTVVSMGNYFFHFLMARILSVVDYGELQSLLAISVIMGVPTASLLTVLVKYSAHFKAQDQLGKIHSLFSVFSRKVGLVGIGFFVLFFVFKDYLANFLKLNSLWPVLILGVSFVPSFLSSVNTGIIQGLERFKSASVIGVIGVVVKILLSLLLVKIGFAINGAMGGIVLAAIGYYFISLWPLKFLFKEKKQELETRSISQYLLPTFFVLLFLGLLYNIDIVLVKHFLSPEIAGQYGALAIIGHIIFFIGGPIAAVMFPMSASAFSNGKDSSLVFKKAIILVGLIGLGSLFFYFLFPEIIIKVLVGSKFLAMSNVLVWFGLAMLFYSFLNLLSKYFLSIHRTKCLYFLGIGVFLQTILIAFFHQSLDQVVLMMNITMLFTLGLLLIYYFKISRGQIPAHNYG